MENTKKAAGDGLLPCFALKSRFVQHDIKNENGNALNAAKAAFARFLNDTSLDSRQIWFVNRIVDYIVQNGMMLDRSVLMEEPFSNDQISFAKIFDDEIWQNILSAIDEVNGNMAAAELE